MQKLIFRMLIVAGLSALVLSGCTPPEQKEAATTSDGVSTPAAIEARGWLLLDGTGRTLELEALKGRVVLLDFWATWCPPCKKELPELAALYTQMESQGVTLVGMTVDQGSAQDVAAAVAPFDLPYPVVLADEDAQKQFGGIRAVPTKFLLDKEGQVVEKYVGLVSIEKLKTDIEKLLVD